MESLIEEHAKRQAMMHAVAQEFAEKAVLTWRWLESVDFGWGPQRLKDASKGIWNPRDYQATLTIVSDPDGEYGDGFVSDSLFRYSYEKQPPGQDPLGGSNRKLRKAMELGLPIVMFQKVGRGLYVPIMPVYVVKDEPENRSFLLGFDESLRFFPDPDDWTSDHRHYAEVIVSQRLHQPRFRSTVLQAYDLKCAVCELKKVPLLDAAHITSDKADDGFPVVSNGLAMCKIHHAAYDERILGVSPDYVVHINSEVLQETDGPMLKFGLQQMHGRTLYLPKTAAHRPDQERLERRFDEFLKAG